MSFLVFEVRARYRRKNVPVRYRIFWWVLVFIFSGSRLSDSRQPTFSKPYNMT